MYALFVFKQKGQNTICSLERKILHYLTQESERANTEKLQLLVWLQITFKLFYILNCFLTTKKLLCSKNNNLISIEEVLNC
jgi:hypothetical protein